jgi:DNA primase
MSLLEHLRSRHLDIDLHRPIIDEENDLATFYLWNLSGCLIGFQQYRRFGVKKPNNNPKEGKYFTFRKQPTLTVWGIESLHLKSNILYVTEGVFDAARITKKGFPAIAVLSNSPNADLKNWLQCLSRTIVVVADNDNAGKMLAKFGDYAEFTQEKDLGDSSEEFVDKLLQKY